MADLIGVALAGPFVWRTVMPPQGGPELAESLPSQTQRPVQPGVVGALRTARERGMSTRSAAARCGVSQSTASRYYRRFEAEQASSANAGKGDAGGVEMMLPLSW
ncbi:helix-turn-helix domain-containing protein [Kitasatospora sp. NPDC056184]|uniref:helix-turn-helix domain-containing protein n=1 Tax=Kitasatospora sp. NPDC056184 TaxID=3345738 RepID=UPI0035DDE7E3